MMEVKEDFQVLRHFFQELKGCNIPARYGSASTLSGSGSGERSGGAAADIFLQDSQDIGEVGRRDTITSGLPSSHTRDTSSSSSSCIPPEVSDPENSSRKIADLTKKVAELTAECARLECELTESQLQQRALTNANTILQEKMSKMKRHADFLEIEKNAAAQTLQKEQRTFEERVIKWSAIRRDFELLKKDYSALHEHQWDALLSTSSELEKLTRKLIQENMVLKEKVQGWKELEKHLKKLEEENLHWKREAAAKTAQREQWEHDWEEVQRVSHQCKALAEQLQEYWSSTQREVATLREALEAAHFVLQQYEGNAIHLDAVGKGENTSGLLPLEDDSFPLPTTYPCSPAAASLVKITSDIHGESTGEREGRQKGKEGILEDTKSSLPLRRMTDPFSSFNGKPPRASLTTAEKEAKDQLLTTLEAKTVDLAIALHAAEAEAELKNVQYEALASQCLQSSFPFTSEPHEASPALGLTHFQEELAQKALLPLCEALQERNCDLEAKLSTAEHTTHALMEVYQLLLQEYTEESFHSFRLEGALAERILNRPPSPQNSETPRADRRALNTSRAENAQKKKERFTINYHALH